MKKPSTLTKWGGAAGALAAVLGLVSQVGPPVINWVLSERDGRIKDVQSEIIECEERVAALEELAESALDASEKRFQDGELHAVELRGALESLRNEVQVRHGNMEAARTLPPTPRRRSRAEVIEELEAQSYDHLKSARTNAPRHTSLRKMIERKEKPDEVMNPWN